VLFLQALDIVSFHFLILMLFCILLSF